MVAGKLRIRHKQILLTAQRSEGEGVTCTDIAVALRMTRQTIYNDIYRLQCQGLVEELGKKPGKTMPHRVWGITDRGVQALRSWPLKL